MVIKKVEKQEVVENTTKETKTVAKKPVKKQVDLSEMVPVINMSQASFEYTARKGNGYLLLENYLDTDYMTIEDLQIMKNTQRGVFKKGWLFIDDEDAVEYLGLKKEMDAILSEDELNEFFTLDTETIQNKLQNYSTGMKENIYHALKIKFNNDEVSNVKTIKTIENSLGIDDSLSIINTLN